MNNNKKLILTKDHQVNLVNDFLNAKSCKKMLNKKFGIYHLDVGDKFISLAKHIEATVFKDAFGNPEEMLYEEFYHLDKNSSFILAIDHHEKIPVATLRMMKNSDKGFKTLNSISAPPWSCDLDSILNYHQLNNRMNKIMDISTLAIIPGYRSSSGTYIGLLLYLSLYGICKTTDMEHLIALLDNKAFKSMLKFNFPVAPIKGTFSTPYLGSEATIPIIIDVKKFMQDVNHNTNSIKKIKLMAILADRHISIEDKINFDSRRWLTLFEKYSYPLISYIPSWLFRMVIKSKKT